MRVLLSDGSGLTARQCATRLAAAGHVVDVLTPDPLCLCRFTRHVARVHRVPPYGPDPLRWLDAAVDVYRSGRFDVLFPTQEQVAVLSWAKAGSTPPGSPPSSLPSLRWQRCRTRSRPRATLRRLGIPQPETATEAEGWDRLPSLRQGPHRYGVGGVRRCARRANSKKPPSAGPC